MWNWNSLRVARACRKLGRVAPACRAAPTHEGALPTREGALPTREGALPTREGALPTREGALITHMRARVGQPWPTSEAHRVAASALSTQPQCMPVQPVAAWIALERSA